MIFEDLKLAEFNDFYKVILDIIFSIFERTYE